MHVDVPSARKRVAVVYDHGSASPTDVLDAATGLVEVLFVGDVATPHVHEVAELLVDLAATRTFDSSAGGELADALTGEIVDGVVTFSDAALRLAAHVGECTGVDYHTPETAVLITDKLAQRVGLHAAGVAVPRLFELAGPADLPAAAAAVGFPSVLKPRTSNGSRYTYAIGGPADLAAVATAIAEVPAGYGGFILEERIIGDPDIAGPAWGDYVSVESLVLGGEIRHVGVVGRLPLTAPFRETGIFYPSTLPDDALRSVEAEAEAALRAMGITGGLCHTEIKLTADGPRVIEVNGRLGGETAKVIKAASGTDLVRMALAAAVREDAFALEELAKMAGPAAGVSYQISAFPQVGGELAGLDGLDEVRALDGVRRVVPCKRKGETVDVDMGTFSELASVYGTAADHEQLRQICRAVELSIVPRWSAADLRPSRTR